MPKRKASREMRTIGPRRPPRLRLFLDPVNLVAAAMLVMITSVAAAQKPPPIESVLKEIDALPMPALPLDIHEFYLRLCARGDTLLVTGGSQQGFTAWAALFRVENGRQGLDAKLMRTISEPGERVSETEMGNYLHPAWLRDGRFILYDPQLRRMGIYGPAGDLIREFDPYDGEPYMRHNIYDILVTPGGEIVFAGEAIDDYSGVHVYDPELRHLRSFWSLGKDIVKGPGTSMNLLLDGSGGLWVAHGRFGAIHHYDLEGKLLEQVPEPGGYFRAPKKLPIMAGRKTITRWFQQSVFLRCPARLLDGRLVLRFDTRDAKTNRWSYVVEIVDPTGRVDPIAFSTDLRLLGVDRDGVLQFAGTVDETKPWRIRRFEMKPVGPR